MNATVSRLSPREALGPPKRSPERQRLADVLMRNGEIAAELLALQTPADERRAAIAALPGAEAKLKDLLFSRELGDVDADALEASRDEVKRLRVLVSATPDHSAKIAELHAEAAQLADVQRLAHRAAVVAEIDKLAGAFAAATKMALAAESALRGCHAWAMANPEYALLDKINAAQRWHVDHSEAARRNGEVRAILGEVQRVWTAYPQAILGDADAEAEPLVAAVALMPARDEERGQ